MNNYYLSIFLILIFISIIAYNYIQQNHNQTQEPFTAKINQFWRPHYRNLSTYTSDTLNTSVGNIKRTLRQNGLL
jgi:hypothetical protein